MENRCWCARSLAHALVASAPFWSVAPDYFDVCPLSQHPIHKYLRGTKQNKISSWSPNRQGLPVLADKVDSKSFWRICRNTGALTFKWKGAAEVDLKGKRAVNLCYTASCYMPAHTYACVCGDQRTSCGSQVSLTTWVLGIELKLPGLSARVLPLSSLAREERDL